MAKAKAKPVTGEPDAKTRALLEAIWANAEDDQALRVYADHMTDLGDSRGEYINLVLEGSDRAQTILERDRGKWLGAARPFVRSWSNARTPYGFVDQVWCEAKQLIAGMPTYRWLGPKVVVVVTSMRTARRATEARMATLPLHELYTLDLSMNALDDKSITTLAPALQGCRALHLDGNEITGAGIAALGKVVTTLEFLQVGAAIKFYGEARTALVDGIAEAIATTPGFRSLRYLRFFRTGGISPARAAQLHALPNLTRISVSGNTEWRGRDEKSWTAEHPENI